MMAGPYAVLKLTAGYTIAGFLVTSIMFPIAANTMRRFLTSDRLAFFGLLNGAITGVVLAAAVTRAHMGLLSLLLAIPGAAGGWAGSMNATEPGDRGRIRKTVERVRNRQYL